VPLLRWPEHEVHVWIGVPRVEEVLRAYLGTEPQIELGPHGKPRVDGLHFNLSHSGHLRILAVARHEVGVDVEIVSDRGDVNELAAIGLPAEQAAHIATVPANQRNAVFHRLWVRHEARLKCHGVGLVAPLPADAADVVIDLNLGPGVAAAVAVQASARSSAAWPPPITALQWDARMCSTGSSSSGRSASRSSAMRAPSSGR
jgi:phosphopantetheinyl transferase